ncbi:carbonic anhydrase [Tatlockia micdadei]|uniref:carbonic anhydrase n=1 Tax=Legionella micdadei TaxID=451 RepID=UPI00156FFF7C|nr:carbonic anhydrase [Legionella micdadei]NSL18740.1 carbonic anhydrase [Legionella micdadei]
MLIKLILGVRKFNQEKFKDMQGIFEMLSRGQYPDILFITCADSRVVPSLFTHSAPGDMFVMRNVGNIVPPHTATAVPSEAVAIEYALKVLKVKNIIVCGHSNCGAMDGLITPGLDKHLPVTASWLSHSSPVLAKLAENHEDINLEAVIKQNILVQMEHLKTYRIIAEKIAAGELSIHGWFYKFETGEIFVYQETQQNFINMEQALNFAIEGRRDQIVKQIANGYLAQFTQPKTSDEFRKAMRLFSSLKFDLSAIWDDLRPMISEKLWAEVGELFSGPSAKEFQDLIDSGKRITLRDLKDFQKELQSSVGYHQFCAQHTLFAQSLSGSDYAERNLNQFKCKL